MNAPHELADALRRDTARERDALLAHPLYDAVREVSALRVFMAAHVFAVWDFMCLLKTLQRGLTCVSVPWVPPRDREAARLINEIVLGEETDTVEPGRSLSHFELYLDAMREVGASTAPVERFVHAVREGVEPLDAMRRAGAPDHAVTFVAHTLRTAREAPLHAVAASFLYGREDLVPAMFRRVLATLPADHNSPSLVRYLERHIELDEGSHGPASAALLARLCADDPARLAGASLAAREALAARRALWSATLAALPPVR